MYKSWWFTQKTKSLSLRSSFKLRCRHIKLKEPTSIFFRHIARIHLDTDVLYLRLSALIHLIHVEAEIFVDDFISLLSLAV